ncbi:cold shock domain-containing protein [Cytophagaceae bacterium YF14B1]|uniref:Cold shock domain-containing protein n=1 Tax=Xanthocytophaga flava TaxID=3048013 RepID=A0AAE3U602_9BACT|nr:cold shock domain-containing protein [Xanthocytophaga flavus]MDJ1480826.1 cold shock domain-containing protein [Xanthocytophaga flavus]
MARSSETFSKKENIAKKLKRKKDKAERKAERKTHSDKGKDMEAMFVYVDADGYLSSTPPDPKQKRVIKNEEISIGVSRQSTNPQDNIRTGKVTFYNETKGYGFIKDSQSQQSVFVHANGLSQPIKENDKVTFLIEKNEKGPSAIRVKLAS